MKNRANEAVSDIIGTVLLLGMTIALFSVLCIGVLSYPSSSCEPAVNLVGTINDGNLSIEHCGGEALDLNTKIIITCDGDQVNLNVGEFFNDENEDDKWNIGEGFKYPLVGYIGKQVKFTVVDADSNTIILLGSLEGR
jgi:hypothetical protein